MLVHVGYQKTGTKWLRDGLFRNREAGYHWLPKHAPPIWSLVYADPLRFDAEAARRELAPMVAEAEADGLVPVISWGRLVGVAFSGGYDTKLIADRIAGLVPEAKIVVVIREQRSMIVSTYKQYVKTGGTASIHGFLQPAKWQGKIPTFRFDFFEYDRVIGYYRSLFGDDSVLALPYEYLVAERAAFVSQVAEFAGRPVPDDVLTRIVKARRRNTAQSALVMGATRPLNRFGPPSELNPAPLLGSERVAEFAARIRKRVDPSEIRAARALADRSERILRQAAATTVDAHYVESNRRTAELIGIDLAQYGWMV